MKNKYKKYEKVKGGYMEKNKRERKEHISRIVTIIIITMMAILMLFSGYSMAKMLDASLIKVSSQIAEPIVFVESNPSIDITADKNFGTYTFRIKNYDSNNKITESDLKYYIEILSNLDDDSVNIELYKGEEKINLSDKKTAYMELSKNEKQDIEYKVKIVYDKDKSNSIEDIIQKIQVKVHTEQMKV